MLPRACQQPARRWISFQDPRPGREFLTSLLSALRPSTLSLPDGGRDSRTFPTDRGQEARHIGDGDFTVDQLLYDFGAHSSCDDFVLVFVVPDVDTQTKYGRKYADGANVVIGNETQTLRVGTLVIDTSRVKILEDLMLKNYDAAPIEIDDQATRLSRPLELLPELPPSTAASGVPGTSQSDLGGQQAPLPPSAPSAPSAPSSLQPKTVPHTLSNAAQAAGASMSPSIYPVVQSSSQSSLVANSSAPRTHPAVGRTQPDLLASRPPT